MPARKPTKPTTKKKPVPKTPKKRVTPPKPGGVLRRVKLEAERASKPLAHSTHPRDSRGPVEDASPAIALAIEKAIDAATKIDRTDRPHVHALAIAQAFDGLDDLDRAAVAADLAREAHARRVLALDRTGAPAVLMMASGILASRGTMARAATSRIRHLGERIFLRLAPTEAPKETP